ncbi:hypothetical protein BSKO_10047 [Bryopsis sp. KO-2023]|nr:hypothetical protein BSKO_10047 [Bryopsis sp. KO-2023]
MKQISPHDEGFTKVASALKHFRKSLFGNFLKDKLKPLLQAGTVPPQSSAQTKIRWTPKEDQQPGPHESSMSLVLQGGSENHKKVRLRAELSEASLQFSNPTLDVGPIPCGVPQTIVVLVRNTGAHDAAFRVVGNDRLRCTPSKGKVAPEEVFEVEVAFACSEPGSFRTELELELRNQQHISLPITAQALVPQVLAKQDIFDFCQVHTGGSARLAVNLTNATPVPALLTVDLSSQPNFELILPKENWSPAEYEECPLKRATRDSDAFSVCSTRCSKRIPSTALSGIPDEVGLIRREGYKYQIKLNPSGALELLLLFRPTEEQKYDFPITMLISTNTSAAGAPINVPVAAEGLKSRLLFSRTRIDFGTQIVQRSQQMKVPYGAEVRVSNNDDLAIELKLPQNEGNSIFSINPTDLTLEPGETKNLAVQFLPSNAEFYEETVPIRLDDEDPPSMELQILGMGQYPRLRFDRREVILPAVPLDMRSEAKFHVVNDGFDNLELRYRLPADDLHVPLSIEFPEGSLIGIAKERLPVIVSFQAAQPMSFTANIDFLDEEGTRYSILVTGTTDNSILTIEPFLQISTLSANKKEAAEQLLGHFDWMVTHLKSHGALLNTVRPELLLEAEDFQRIMLGRATKASTLEEEDAIDLWKVVEENFELFSKQAWSTLFLQITKIFLFSRVTLKGVRDICNIEQLPQINQKVLIGSNIYSVAESILLEWLTENLRKGLPECSFRVTNFDSDLRSGVVLFALLLNHWPALVRYAHTLVKKPVKDEQFKTNAELIVRMIQDINLPFPIKEHEIMNPNASEMPIFILYLYQTLPELIPRTVVDFTGRLGEHQVKTIQLSNPSKKVLIYSTRLEGHADFEVDTSVVKIDPKSTAELTVSCTPTIAIPQESRLVLLSRRDGGAHASTLVFNLRSLVNCRAPLKQIKTEMALYDFQRFEFTVNNPFPADCEFSIRLRHEPALPVEVPAPPEQDKGAKRTGQKSSAASKPKREPSIVSGQEGVDSSEKVFPDSFGVDKSRLRIKHNGSDKLKGSFLPFTTGSHYCTVIFEDKEYGEFCYELVGEVTLPAVFSEHRFTVETDGSQALDIYVPYSNHQLESARRVFQDKHPLGKDKEQLALLKASREDKFGEMSFQINQSNSLVTAPACLLLKHSPQTQGGEAQGGLKRGASGTINVSGLVETGKPEQPNTIRVALKPIGTGIYPSRIILTSPYDVRVVDVEISAQKLGETFQLEFKSPAFQTVSQDIPLVNNSEKAMVVQSSCTGLHFQGPREVTVPSGLTGMYPLKFIAPWIGAYTGTLELSIGTTGEKNVYLMQGQSEEPLAEGHIVFECQARTSAVKRINVPNTSPKAVEYKIFSDIGFLSGRESVKVESNSHANYKVTISPPRSGVFHGTLNFETEKGYYVWFSMEVRASEPPEVGVIEVSTRVQFSASYSDESLIGPPVLDLEAEETAIFKFYYAPLKAGDDNGSVSLVNEEVGEFWYQLDMHADVASPITVSPFAAEAGKIDQKTITFDNPLGREVSVIASCSNPQNFRAQPEKFTVGAYGSEAIEIQYEPSSIGEQEKASIFQRGYGTQKEAGRWLLPKLDYIQLLIVKSTVAAVTKAFKKACVGIKNSGAKIDSYLSSESDQPEKKGTALNPLDDSGRPIINTETWKLIKGAGKDVIVSMNELGIPPKVMTLGGGVLLTLVDRGYIPQIDVTSLETFDEVWPIEDGNAGREPLFVERFTLTDAVGSAFASGNVADFFSRAELKEPTFERLVVVYRYNKKPGRIDALKKIFSESQPDAPQPTPREEIQIRVYDGIPMPIWKAVFPEKLLQFRPLDNIRLDLVTLIGLVAVGAQAKYDSVLLEIATFASVVVYLVRVFLGYKRMFDRFDSFVNELLSRKTLAGQEGAIVYLASSAALQQFKHCALAYSLMICRNKALSTKALGNEVEKMLREEGLQVRFESQDALSQLLRLGLVSITRIGAEDFYTAIDPKIGIKRITKHWDDLLKGKIAERY